MLCLETFAKKGASYCNVARCTIESYERFCHEQAACIEGGSGYPPTAEIVTWFVLWRLDATRALKARTGVPFKGTSGKQAAKGLGYAASLFGAPFAPGIPKSPMVEMATKRPSDAVENGTEVTHAGVYVQVWLEHIAATGTFPDGTSACEVQIDFATGLAALGVTSMRFTLGCTLGFILAAVSPAVVVGAMFDLKKRGYGAKKNIPTLVVAAASMDGVVAISGLATFVSIAIPPPGATTVTWVLIALHTPIALALAVIMGLLGGYIAAMTKVDKHWKRVAMVAVQGFFLSFGAKTLEREWYVAGAHPIGASAGILGALAMSGITSFLCEPQKRAAARTAPPLKASGEAESSLRLRGGGRLITGSAKVLPAELEAPLESLVDESNAVPTARLEAAGSLREVESAVEAMLDGAVTPALRRLLQRVFLDAHAAQRRLIEDFHLDEAALELECPLEMHMISENAAKAPFDYEGRAEVGHYVEVASRDSTERFDHTYGEPKRGVLTSVVRDTNLCEVTLLAGGSPVRIMRDKLKSSGSDLAAFLRRMMHGGGPVRDALSRLPKAMQDALAELRRRAACNEMPLLTLVQAEPLQLQASHLIVQEYLAARAICDKKGTMLMAETPWRWSTWWSNALRLGAEMGEPFGHGLLRASGIHGDELSLRAKLGGSSSGDAEGGDAEGGDGAGDRNINKSPHAHRPTALGAVVQMMVGVATLDISNNSLGAEEAKAIAEALEGNKVLTNLTVRYRSSLQNIAGEAAQQLATAVLGSKVRVLSDLPIHAIRQGKITSLDFNSVRMQGRRLEVGEYALGPTRRLEAGEYALGPTEGLVLAELIKGGDALTSVDLVGNHLGPEAGRAIAEALATNTVMSRVNLLNSHIGAEAAAQLAATLQQQKTLKSLCGLLPEDSTFGRTVEDRYAGRLGPADIILMAAELKVNSNLTALRLTKKGLGPEEGKVLAEALKVNKGLTSVDIAENSFGLEGGTALADALKVNASLTKIELRNNKLGDEGWGAIFNGICSNKDSKISSVDASRESIGPRGAELIAEALRDSVSAGVTSVDLSCNKLGPGVAMKLAEALKTNKSLTFLNLATVHIGSEGFEAIAEALEVNNTVTSLNLSGNSLGAKGARAIAEALKGNVARENVALTNLSVAHDRSICGEAAQQLASAVLASTSLEVFSDVPIKELREGKLTTLNLKEKGVAHGLGQAEAIVVAELVNVSTVMMALQLALSPSAWGPKTWTLDLPSLRGTNPVETLEFVGKGIGITEAIVIAKLLRSNSVLTSLDLSRNNLRPEGGVVIAEALETNDALKSLNVSINYLGTEGGKALAKALGGNTSLKQLNVHLNGLKPAVQRALEDAVKGRDGFELIGARAWWEADEENASVAGRPPHFGPEALLESVESGAIAPLRGRWLDALESRNGRLVRRQDLPAEAFWSGDELRMLVDVLGEKDYAHLFVAVSYRWLSPAHPDPDGFHLNIIATVARAYLSSPTKNQNQLASAFQAKGLERSDFALFWDFASLYQKPRSPDEDKLFLPGLKASNVWYGHEGSVVWMQSELPEGFAEDMKRVGLAQTYIESGWCFVEAMISAGVKVGTRRLDLGKRQVPHNLAHQGNRPLLDYQDLTRDCAAVRQAPLMPDEMLHLLETEKQFTAKADIPTVDGLYRSFFEGATVHTTQLDFSALKWGIEQMRQLAVVLPSFVALTTLDLSKNELGVEGTKLIAEHLGGIKSLTTIDLRGNGLDTEAGKALAPMLEAFSPTCCRLLTSLNLNDNQIGAGGVAVIGEAIETNSALTSLALEGLTLSLAQLRGTDPVETLDLSGKQIASGWACIIGKLIKSNQVLKSLNLSNNQLGPEAGKMIVEALETNVTLTSLDLSSTGLAGIVSVESSKVESESKELGSIVMYEGREMIVQQVWGRDNVRRTAKTSMGRYYNLIHRQTGQLQLADVLNLLEFTASLTKALRTNQALTSLNLRNNGLGPQGGLGIAKALEANSAGLTALDLSEDQCSALETIAEASEVHGESKEVGSRVIYRGDEMAVTHMEGGKLYMLPEHPPCSFGTAGGEAIANALRAHKTLRSLDLCHEYVGAKGGLAIAEALETNNTLTSLNLVSNHLGPKGGQAIGEALTAKCTLTSLSLGANHIGVEGAKAIAEALETNDALTNLSVAHDRSICGEAAQQLASAVLASTSLEVFSDVPIKELREGKLTTLDLMEKGLGQTEGVVVAQLITSAAVLSSVNLAFNNFRETTLKLIAEAAVTNTVLESLTLEGAALHLPQLRGTDPVETLELVDKGFQVASAIVIAKLIKGNQVLTSLDLSRNQIGPEGGKFLGEALETNASLKSLVLVRTGLGQEGGEAICNALKANVGLTSIDLHSNNLGPDGGQMIAEALGINRTLESLDIRWIGEQAVLPPQASEAIATALQTNTVLTSLNVYDQALNLSQLRGTDPVEELDLSTSDYQVGDHAFIIIAKLIEGNQVATALKFRSLPQGSEAAQAIGNAMATNTKLISLQIGRHTRNMSPHVLDLAPLRGTDPVETIDLSGQRVSDAMCMIIAKLLERNRALTSLALSSENGFTLSDSIGLEGCKAIVDAVGDSKVLKSIQLNGVAFKLAQLCGTEPIEALEVSMPRESVRGFHKGGIVPAFGIFVSKLVERNRALTSVTLDRHELGPEGVKAIAEALEHSTSLTSLSLPGCGNRGAIGPEGAKAFAKALTVNSVLVDLNLAANGLCGVSEFSLSGGTRDNSGATALAEALNVNAALTKLNINGNYVDDEFLLALAPQCKLTILSLEACRIGSTGSEGLAKYLETSVVEDLDLSNNNLSVDCAKAIADALAAGAVRLKRLNIAGNLSIKREAAQQLAMAVLASTSLEVFSNVPIKELRDGGKLMTLDLKVPESSWNMSLGQTECIVVAQLIEVSSVLVKVDLTRNRGLCERNLGESYDGSAVIALAKALKVSTVLTDLNLAQTSLCDEAAAAIAEGLAVNKSLVHLDLSSNSVCPEGGAAIAKALAVNVALKTLNLASNCLSGQRHSNGRVIGTYDASGITALAAALEVNNTLTGLHLQGKRSSPIILGVEGAQALFSSLAVNTRLSTLNLASCGIDAEACRALTSALEVNKALADLDLSDNRIWSTGNILGKKGEALLGTYEESDSTALAEALKVNVGLTHLDLGYSGLSTHAGKVLASMLEANARLASISLSGSQLAEEVVLSIVRAIHSQDQLTTLGLATCDISAPGAKEIAEYVSASALLKELNVAHNPGICGEAAQQLALAVLASTSLEVLSAVVPIKELREGKLTTLDLADKKPTFQRPGKGLGPTEGIVIAALMKTSQVLVRLALPCNSIQDEGASAIGESLRVNKSLTELDLSECGIGPAGAKAIAAGLEGSSVLQKLSLSSNEITDEGVIAIGESLRSNTTLSTLELECVNGSSEEQRRGTAVTGTVRHPVGEEAHQVIKEIAEGRVGFEFKLKTAKK